MRRGLEDFLSFFPRWRRRCFWVWRAGAEAFSRAVFGVVERGRGWREALPALPPGQKPKRPTCGAAGPCGLPTPTCQWNRRRRL